jgi:hypothetical protein
LGIPALASEDHRTEHLIPEVRILFEDGLQKNLKLHYDIGAEWDGEDTNPDWIYTISPQVELSDKISVFIEEYGLMHQGEKPKHYLDGGFDYNISVNVKFDLFGGVGISSEASDYVISSGISFRFRR